MCSLLPDVERTYLVPLADIAAYSGWLRIAPPKNRQEKKVRWAERYLLEPGREGQRLRSIGPVQWKCRRSLVVKHCIGNAKSVSSILTDGSIFLG